MQFSLLTMLACTSAFAAAAPQDPETVSISPAMFMTEKRACTYETAVYLSTCHQGENVFCSGNDNVCGQGQVDTQDATTTKANEESCVGVNVGDSCTQSIACC